MAEIICPECGAKIHISPRGTNRLGRKPLGHSVIFICDTLQACQSVQLAAERMGCSRGYIYAELAKFGTTPKDVIEGRWKPPARPRKRQPAKLKKSQNLR